VDHGPSFFAELALFRKAGLTFRRYCFLPVVADEEIERGNFLLVKKDFITTREIEAVYQRGQRIEP